MASQRSTRYSSRRHRDGSDAGSIGSASGSIGSSQHYCTELDQNPRLDADGCGNDGFANYDAASQGTDSLSLPSVGTLEWNRSVGQRRRGPAAASAAMLARGGGGMSKIAAAATASRAGNFVEQTAQTNATVIGDSGAVGTAAAFAATGKSRLSAAGAGTGLAAGVLAGQEAQQLVQPRSARYMPIVGGRQNCASVHSGAVGPDGSTIPGMGLLDTTNVDPQRQPGGELAGCSNEELMKLKQLLAAEEARRGLGGGRGPGGSNTSAASGLLGSIDTGGSGEDEDANSDISSTTGVGADGAARAHAMMPSRNPSRPTVAVSTTSTAASATESQLALYRTKKEEAESAMTTWHGIKLYQLKGAKSIVNKVEARERALRRLNPKMNSSSLYKRAKAKELARNPDAIFSAQVEWTKNHYFDATSAIGTVMHRIKTGIELPQAITGCPGGQRPSDDILFPTRKENDAEAAKYYNDFILRQIRKECGLNDDGNDNDASSVQAMFGAVPNAAPSNAIGHAGAPLTQGAPFASPLTNSRLGISGTSIPDVSTLKVSNPGSVISARAEIQLESGIRKAQVNLDIEDERSALERQLAEEQVDRINEEKAGEDIDAYRATLIPRSEREAILLYNEAVPAIEAQERAVEGGNPSLVASSVAAAATAGVGGGSGVGAGTSAHPIQGRLSQSTGRNMSNRPLPTSTVGSFGTPRTAFSDDRTDLTRREEVLHTAKHDRFNAEQHGAAKKNSLERERKDALMNRYMQQGEMEHQIHNEWRDRQLQTAAKTTRAVQALHDGFMENAMHHVDEGIKSAYRHEADIDDTFFAGADDGENTATGHTSDRVAAEAEEDDAAMNN